MSRAALTDGFLCDTVVDMDIPREIGNNLDRILTNRIIGRREFARKMGIQMSSYSRLLNGTTEPKINTLYRALGAINNILLERNEGPITINSLLRGCPKYGTDG